MIFDKIAKRLPEVDTEIFCPFCGAGYCDPREIRLWISCPICTGRASRAIEAMEEVDKIRDNLWDYPIEKVEEFIRKLSGGVQRMEYREHWRERTGK